MYVSYTGGIHGMSYVFKEHRDKWLFRNMLAETYSRALLRKEVILAETSRPVPPNYERIGLSHYIILSKPTNMLL